MCHCLSLTQLLCALWCLLCNRTAGAARGWLCVVLPAHCAWCSCAEREFGSLPFLLQRAAGKPSLLWFPWGWRIVLLLLLCAYKLLHCLGWSCASWVFTWGGCRKQMLAWVLPNLIRILIQYNSKCSCQSSVLWTILWICSRWKFTSLPPLLPWMGNQTVHGLGWLFPCLPLVFCWLFPYSFWLSL